MSTVFYGGDFFGGGFFGDAAVVVTDTHDDVDRQRRDDEAFARRDREIRDERARLRAELRAAVERVTGRPPSLDASPKELASIARKSESFDYAAALAEIGRLEAGSAALREEREQIGKRAEAEQRTERERKKRVRRQEEEALLTLLLNL